MFFARNRLPFPNDFLIYFLSIFCRNLMFSDWNEQSSRRFVRSENIEFNARIYFIKWHAGSNLTAISGSRIRLQKRVPFFFKLFVWSVWQVGAETRCSCTLNNWKISRWTCKRARNRKISDLPQCLILSKSIFYRPFEQFFTSFFVDEILLRFKLLRDLYLQHRTFSLLRLSDWLRWRCGLAKKRKNFALFLCGEKTVLAWLFEK